MMALGAAALVASMLPGSVAAAPGGVPGSPGRGCPAGAAPEDAGNFPGVGDAVDVNGDRVVCVKFLPLVTVPGFDVVLIDNATRRL